MAVAGASAAWAVGYRDHYKPRHPFTRTQLIESWNGTRWRVDQTPSLAGDVFLKGVVALAANDVWAVGVRSVRPSRGNVAVYRTLIEHWDGTVWTVIPSPNIGPATDRRITASRRYGWEVASDNELLAVAAASTTDIWAVGEYAVVPPRNHRRYYSTTYREDLLSEHWDGTSWNIGPPFPGGAFRVGIKSGYQFASYGLDVVAAAPSGEVLAFELALIGGGWWFNGSGWASADPTHALERVVIYPNAAAATAADDAWILGNAYDDPSAVEAAHWDGQQWVPQKLAADGIVSGAAASAPDDVWAVGNLGATLPVKQQLTLHYTC